MNKRNVIASALVAVSAASWTAGVSLAHAQSRNDAAPFQIMEATIDDIHAAFKSGTADGAPAGPGLSRPHRRL